MINSPFLRRCLIALAVAAFTSHAIAGRSCEEKLQDAKVVQRAMELAEHTAAHLEETGAQVVVLARVGQDLRKYGLHYSHFGLAYRDTRGERPVWRVVHKLNACGTALSSVYRQGLGEFFLDDLFDFEASVVVLQPQLQVKLLKLLQDNARAVTLHSPAYSMLSYAWAQKYQQSNQWAIETLAMAADAEVDSREKAQAWLRLKGYEPTTLHLSALTRLGARITTANIAFDDHPDSQRYGGVIQTVTVDSVMAWLERSGLGGSTLSWR